MKSSTKNIVYQLPLELLNSFRIRILGNSKIMGKTQKWVETQYPLQKKNKKLVLVVKNNTKTDIKVSRPVHVCLIS